MPGRWQERMLTVRDGQDVPSPARLMGQPPQWTRKHTRCQGTSTLAGTGPTLKADAAGFDVCGQILGRGRRLYRRRRVVRGSGPPPVSADWDLTQLCRHQRPRRLSTEER